MNRVWALGQDEVGRAIGDHVKALVGYDRIGPIQVTVCVMPVSGIVDVPEGGYVVTAQVTELEAPKA